MAAALVVLGVLGVLGAGAAGVRAKPAEPPVPPVRALVAQAFGALDAGDFDRAKAIAARLDDPLLVRTLTWFRLILQRGGGDYAEYRAFMDANPGWPYPITLRYRAEGVMPADLPDAEVLAFFAERGPVSAYGHERYADALAATGENTAAHALLRKAWLSEFMTPADEARFVRQYGELLDRALHRKRLERLVWAGKFAAAERQADRVDAGYAALARARILLASREPGVDAAIRAVPAELREHPGLTFERARWRMRKRRFDDAVRLLDPPLAEVPQAARWWPIRHRAARISLDRGDISVAYRIAAHHGLTEGLGFAEGEWLAGWIALRWLREPATALPHFERLYAGVTTPVSRARGAYWAGRAAEAAGRAADARRWFETAATNLTTYYGQLAAQRLREDIFFALPVAPKPSMVEARAFAADEVVRAIRLLAALGQHDRLDRFFNHLEREAKTRVRAQMTADLAVSVGRPDIAVRLARSARRQGLILPDHLYPVVDLPLTEAPTRDETALVLAVVRQESGFDPKAVSSAGARGMMQLMPATAKAVARKLDIDPARHDLSEPGYNVLLGSTYLDQLTARYDGSLLLAVAAYNAGPSRLNAWLKRYGDPRDPWIDPIDWVETLPFAETRNYIQRVFESLTIYRHRMAPRAVAVALDRRLRETVRPGRDAENSERF
jgi:soluble lytic murein transglycosylase